MRDTTISRKFEPPPIPGYELLQLVGRGGMGEVHQATQLSLQRVVAVKLLKPELATDRQFVARFEQEGAALASLRHPQIVSIVDRGKAGDTYYLVMEFVDGPSLREKMRDPDFDSNQALVTVLLVAKAIEYAHRRGVIHRDLKPENILFDEQAGHVPKVTDFGLAGFDESHGPQKRNLTQTHISMGTVSYMAPEQSIDAKSAGPRADLYSLGVILYETLTGELPVGQFDPPSTKKPGLDKRLDLIVARCLKPDPAERYPSVTAFIADLEKVVQLNSFLSTAKENPTQRFIRRAKEIGRRVGRTFSMVVVMLALTIVGAVFLRSRSAGRRVASGVELMTDFGAKFPLSAGGRLDKKTRELTMGEGPDTVGLMALGRKPKVKGGIVDFGVAEDDARTGRVVVDADLMGSGVDFSALVDTQDTPPGRLEPLWELFRGPRPDARSALMLLGEHGRYVALVVSGGQTEPTLEWALGPDKRGYMQAPLPVKRLGQRLAIRMDPETGELFAVTGEGRDARVLGDGLWLGANWRQLMGESPRLAVGCLEGHCVFRHIRIQGLEMPGGLSPPPMPYGEMEARADAEPSEQQGLKMPTRAAKSKPSGKAATQKLAASKQPAAKPSAKASANTKASATTKPPPTKRPATRKPR